MNQIIPQFNKILVRLTLTICNNYLLLSGLKPVNPYFSCGGRCINFLKHHPIQFARMIKHHIWYVVRHSEIAPGFRQTSHECGFPGAHWTSNHDVSHLLPSFIALKIPIRFSYSPSSGFPLDINLLRVVLERFNLLLG